MLTSSRLGLASRCLPELVADPRIELAGLVLAETNTANKERLRRRKREKLRRIGLLGALNGIRIRSWYRVPRARDVVELAREAGVPVHESPIINSDPTREIFREAAPDIALSLGNSYIAASVFSIPKFGMLNVHMEVLPRFQGAQSVIWPIYEGIPRTGYSIHQIDKGIDTGALLRVREWEMEFGPNLRATVERNIARGFDEIPADLCDVVANYPEISAAATVQQSAGSYTTPSFGQFLRMLRNHARLARDRSAQSSR